MIYGIVAAILTVVLLARVVGGHSGMRQGDVLLAVMAVAAGGKFLLLADLLDVTVARVLTESATVASFVVGMEMLRTWWSGGSDNPVWTWFWRISTAVVLLAIGASTLLSADTLVGVAAKGEQPVFASSTVMTFRYVALGAWVTLLATVMLALIALFARHTRPGAVRQSLLLVAGCEASFAVYGVLWMAQGLTDPTTLATPWADAALMASRVGALFIASAFLRVNLGRIPGVRRWSDRRALHALAPIWEQLRPLEPEASLIKELPPTTRGLSSTDLQWTLCRVTVEIREWLTEVAVRLPVGAYSTALEASRATGCSDVTSRAAAGQAWLAAGLAAGDEELSDGRDRPPVGADLDEELAQLLLLARRLNRRGRQAAHAAAVALSSGITSPLRRVRS